MTTIVPAVLIGAPWQWLAPRPPLTSEPLDNGSMCLGNLFRDTVSGANYMCIDDGGLQDNSALQWVYQFTDTPFIPTPQE